ncbi:hypothetical protein ACFO1B_20495 [Dactylosporangium siamense]|uniref:Uncharacterized protein n=1 Tax=Dactylosporangium siamense TaxID=685454 RepID=A0A919U9H4_9ACTN|nr:hypothetical protein [Dactylosporangium siamense]GIG46887.1 hypothetical protein Dsi01nite_049280 [Dactylosporangium siamense]
MIRKTAVALALAWLVPLATHPLGLDFVLPVLILAGTVAIQRGGVTLADRVMAACAQLFGAACVFGLAITLWPGHLHPTLIAGTALTALILIAVATQRTPELPGMRKDALLAIAVAGVSVVALVPYAVRDLGGRLGLPLAGEDIARHYLLFDVIGRTGGYLFMRPEALRPFVPDAELTGIANYPQGLHFSYAVLDRFARSSAHNAAPVTAVDVMMWLLVGTYLLLVLAILWAARRIAGPGATNARLLPVLALVAAWLVLGDPVTVLSRGYPNELAGLACAAVLTALVARPLTRLGEQTATVALLLVGISFTYSLFLPYAGIVAALWAVRARLWRHWWAWVVAVTVGGLAAIGPLTAAQASSGDQLLLNGTARVVDRPATALLVALAAVAVLQRRRVAVLQRRRVAALRSRTDAVLRSSKALRSSKVFQSRNVAAFALATAGAMAVGLGTWQIVTIGRPVYYFDKLLHLLIVVALCALGGLARFRWKWTAAAVAAPVALFMLVAGGEWHTTPVAPGVKLALGRDRGSPEAARDALLIARMFPDGGNAVNVNLMGSPWRNWSGTLGAAALQGQYRQFPGWSALLYPGGKGGTMADLDRLVANSPVTVRFFLHDPTASLLVVDKDHPNRPAVRAGQPLPVAFGDPAAPSNFEAARLLAATYPTKVQLVYATPANP